jgi:hypothetical protein
MSPRSLSLAALALAAFSLAAPLEAQSRTVVVGQLIDAQSRAPLSGATVRVVNTDIQAVTGLDGQFRLRLRPGTHNVALYRLGYETALETWDVSDASLDVGMIELAPDAIALEALEVTVDRVEQMRLATGMRSRSFDEDVLARSTYPNALEFVTANYNLIRVPCLTMATSTADAGCVRVRGTPRRPCVVVDEAPAPGGFDALEAYKTQHIARINVYGSGTFFQIYTTAFMRRVNERDWTPMSVEAQMMAFCRFS